MALVLLVAYLLVCIEVYLATHCLGTFTMSFFKIGPTELRILLVVGNLAVFLHPTAEILGHTFLLFDVGGVIAAAGLGVTMIVSAAQEHAGVVRAEPRP